MLVARKQCVTRSVCHCLAPSCLGEPLLRHGCASDVCCGSGCTTASRPYRGIGFVPLGRGARACVLVPVRASAYGCRTPDVNCPLPPSPSLCVDRLLYALRARAPLRRYQPLPRNTGLHTQCPWKSHAERVHGPRTRDRVRVVRGAEHGTRGLRCCTLYAGLAGLAVEHGPTCKPSHCMRGLSR